MAMRNNIIKEIPLDVAEDSILPYYFFRKGYKIAYASKAIVFVKNPTKFTDWLKQRKRTAKAHTKLRKYEPHFPQMKSFKNEILEGSFPIWLYPKKIKETMDIEKLIKEITSNEDALAFTKSKGANIHEARAVTEQTMHDVFYVPSAYENSGIYIKIAKMGKNGPDKKEMEIEAAWYEALRSRLNIPGVPEAKTFQLNEDFALAVEEVQGLTYDLILKNLEKRGVNIKHSKELKKLMEKSAEITARGYALRGEVPTY